MTCWDYFNAHPWLTALWWGCAWMTLVFPAFLVLDEWHGRGLAKRTEERERRELARARKVAAMFGSGAAMNTDERAP